MLVASNTTDQEAAVRRVVAALAKRATDAVEAATQFLETSCRQQKIRRKGQWPHALLSELGAVLELRRWQLSGHLPPSLSSFPPWEELVNALLERTEGLHRTTEPRLVAPSTLERQIFRAWFEESAWGAYCDLNVPIRVEHIDADELLDALTRLLWRHRHLSKTLENEKCRADDPQE